jgi:hypothetical protein
MMRAIAAAMVARWCGSKKVLIRDSFLSAVLSGSVVRFRMVAR